MDTFFYSLSPFSGFCSQSNPHSEDPFLIFKNTSFHNRLGMLLFSKAPQDSIGTTVSKLFISSSVYIRTAKMTYSKNDLFHLAPRIKLLLCPHSIITISTSHIIGKFRSHQKILFTLSKITSNWLGEEGTMGCCPNYFIFKNVFFFIYCTEQNTKEIISVRRCNLLIKTRRNILKWYGSTMFLKQLNSSNNRLTLKTSVNVFFPAY